MDSKISNREYFSLHSNHFHDHESVFFQIIITCNNKENCINYTPIKGSESRDICRLMSQDVQSESIEDSTANLKLPKKGINIGF